MLESILVNYFDTNRRIYVLSQIKDFKDIQSDIKLKYLKNLTDVWMHQEVLSFHEHKGIVI